MRRFANIKRHKKPNFMNKLFHLNQPRNRPEQKKKNNCFNLKLKRCQKKNKQKTKSENRVGEQNKTEQHKKPSSDSD